MKPAIFHLANLNLTVTISPDARRWVQEHIVSLETYAWQQADVFKRGGDVDKGVTVEFIEKPHMTPEDSMCPFERAAAIVEKLREQGELDPSKRPTEKIVREIARGEEYEPIGTMPVVGDTFDLANSSGHVISRNKVEKLDDLSACGPTGAPICDLACFRAAGNGCGWTARILKRERGTELLCARVYKDDSYGSEHAYRSVLIGNRSWYKYHGTLWAARDASKPYGLSVVEITNTPEAAAILADPALLALVGG